MKKVWIYKRPNRTGYWVSWYENGKRKAKVLPTKALAEHYQHIKYQQLNSDVFTSAVNLPWPEVKMEFMKRFEIHGLASETTKMAGYFLARFEKLCFPVSSLSITQKMVNFYLLERKKQGVSAFTLKKDVGRLRTFLNWLQSNHYHSGGIVLPTVKTQATQHRALSGDQIMGLLRQCPTLCWRIRILLSLVTGLRAGDIDRLQVDNVNLKAKAIDTTSQKTGKVFLGRPLPDAIIPELSAYVGQLPKTQVKLFDDTNKRKVWLKIRGNTGITRQDFRRTFSTLIQMVDNISSAQQLLEHSDKRTTETFYSDASLILRWKVNRLPIRDWLK